MRKQQALEFCFCFPAAGARQRPSSGAGVAAARWLLVCRSLVAMRLARGVLAAHRPRRPSSALKMRMRALSEHLQAPRVRLRVRRLRLRALLLRILALLIRLRARKLHILVLWVRLRVRKTRVGVWFVARLRLGVWCLLVSVVGRWLLRV